MKKLIALFLVLVMAISLTACGGDKPAENDGKDTTAQTNGSAASDKVSAEDVLLAPESAEDDFFVVIDSKTETGLLAAYFGSEEIIVVPEILDDAPVTEVDDDVFEDNTTVKAVRFPETVMTIGAYQFKNAKNLQFVYIGAGVKQIGEGAFEGCSEDLVILGIPGSYAEQYASENGIAFTSVEDIELNSGEDPGLRYQCADSDVLQQ